MANPVPNFTKHPELGGRYSAPQAIARGACQIGLPYQWGGSGNPSFDCSGFASWCYFGSRVFTSASADTQLLPYHFAYFPAGSYEKGDVVFFKGDPGHVGIYTGDECKNYGYPNGGPVLQSQGDRGVVWGGHSGWSGLMRPEEGFGIYITKITS